MQRRFALLAFTLILSAALPVAGQERELAKGRPAIASTTESEKYSTAKAIDGDTATGWASLKGDPQWIRVDLGASYQIARVVLNWGIASAKDYRVEISSNDTAWNSIASRSDMPAGLRTDKLKGLSGTGRYLRVFCTERAVSSTQYSLRELKVYGALKSAGAASGGGEGKSGPFLSIGCGMPIPFYDISVYELLTFGVYPPMSFGWQFPAGPGRFKIGLGTGSLIEFTKDIPAVYAQYTSFCIPLCALIAYDLKIAGIFRAYLEAEGGYSATLVFYELPAYKDLGVLKPYAGGAAGIGFDIGTAFTVNAGARFAAVFYDANLYMCVSPELGIEMRF